VESCLELLSGRLLCQSSGGDASVMAYDRARVLAAWVASTASAIGIYKKFHCRGVQFLFAVMLGTAR
jgi:hypothetical protein